MGLEGHQAKHVYDKYEEGIEYYARTLRMRTIARVPGNPTNCVQYLGGGWVLGQKLMKKKLLAIQLEPFLHIDTMSLKVGSQTGSKPLILAYVSWKTKC